jgi:hypothetical protein
LKKTQKCKDTSIYSWIGVINIVYNTQSAFPINEIPVKLPIAFFPELEKVITKFYG